MPHFQKFQLTITVNSETSFKFISANETINITCPRHDAVKGTICEIFKACELPEKLWKGMETPLTRRLVVLPQNLSPTFHIVDHTERGFFTRPG